MGPVTRRGFLLSAAAVVQSGRGRVFPSEAWRYADPLTEFTVYRLTDPAHASTLPAYYSRPISRRGDVLLYASGRAGAMQAFRMELPGGQSRQLTAAEALDPASLGLLPDARGFCYFDGRALRYCSLATLRDRAVYTVAEGWERCRGMSVAIDGLSVLFGEQKAGASRLRAVSLAGGAARTIVQAPFILSDPIPRPRRAQVLYRAPDNALWLVNTDGGAARQLKLGPGSIGPANWAPDGRTLLYLEFPDAIREHVPDTNASKLVATTSRFAHFGFNRDTSVFVGASRNVASPVILLLLRVTRREFTLCEHKSSDAATVAPMFSPDSRRIFFQSDRHGKPAIYTLPVEKLVEPTA